MDGEQLLENKPNKNSEISASAEEISREDDINISQWLRERGSGSVVRITLTRVSPKTWDGHQVGGMLAEFDEPFTEDEIRQRFGGGKFQIKAQKQTSRGNWVYAGARTLEVAGDPKVTAELHGSDKPDKTYAPPPPVVVEDTTMSKKAMDTLERVADKERERADRLAEEFRSKSGFDEQLLRVLTEPMKDRMAAFERANDELRKSLNEKDTKLMELLTKKPEATFQDKILEKMVDGESARIEAIRTQHDSERRQLLQAHNDEITKLRDYARQDMNSKEDSHKREIQSLRDANDSRIESLKNGYEGRLETLKARIADLEMQLTETKKEVTELRLKKEKDPIDQMNDIAKFKSALDALGMGREEAEPAPVWQQVLSGVMESPLAQSIANRIQTAPPAGFTPPTDEAMRKALQQRSQQGQPRPPRQRPPKPKFPPLDPLEVAAAIQYIENSVRNGTTPEAFAQSARTLIPGSIVMAIQMEGIDAFLARVVKLEPGSPLTTQVGRNFIRKVAKILIGDIAPAPETPPETPPEAMPPPQTEPA